MITYLSSELRERLVEADPGRYRRQGTTTYFCDTSAVGLTFVNFSHLMRHHRNQPIRIPLADPDHLPEALRWAVLTVTTTPAVSDFLDITLSLSSRVKADWKDYKRRRNESSFKTLSG